MGREVRRVPADWQHPINERGHLYPLLANFKERLAEWEEGKKAWDEGFIIDYFSHELSPRPADCKSWEEWRGEKPDPMKYMPEWDESEKTHYMMYETCTEGTPISPAFATPEELARFLVESGASAFGRQTASYESWLATILSETEAPSAAFVGGKIVSGVEALKDEV